MTPHTKESSNSTLNVAELLGRVENDRELLHELVTIFKEEFPKQLQALREAVNTSDAKRVAAIAHSLKGMLSNLAAHKAAAGAAQLEQLGRTGEVSAFPNAFYSLDREAAILLRELDTSMIEAHK